jgi:Leucine-rich repeat (LRR) protein
MDMSLLAACSGLQQLQLTGVDEARYGPFPAEALAQQLPRLKALTELVVWGADNTPPLAGPVPAAVWQHTQMRALHTDTWRVDMLPSCISCMRHLQELTLEVTGVAELPHQLGAWLPQLQELDIGSYRRGVRHGLTAIPLGLSRLTGLDVTRCSISSVSAVEHLVQLKRLCIRGNPLEPPFAALAKLTALEHLEISMYEGSGSDEDSEGSAGGEGSDVVLPAALPRLSTLVLRTGPEGDPLPVIRQLVGGAACLTELRLHGIGPDDGHGEDLPQLGPLPALQVLQITHDGCVEYGYDGLSKWLQQQEHVTSLVLHLPKEYVRAPNASGNGRGTMMYAPPLVWGLPPHLEQLQLKGSSQWSFPKCLKGSTSLRVLEICSGSCLDDDGVPEWVTSLTALEEASWPVGDSCDYNQELLALLPLLRKIWLPEACYERDVRSKVPVLTAAPHLCWA